MKPPKKPRINKPLDPVKQFREWMKNTLRRSFFRYWERTKAIQVARVDRGLYKCAICLLVSPMKGHHIDHIDPVVDPKVGFVDWDVYISRLFCSSSNLQLLCEKCHKEKTTQEREERKLFKTGVFKLGRTLPEEVKQKISISHKGIRPKNLSSIQQQKRRIIIAESVATGGVKEFESLTAAGKELNVSTGNIAMVCSGKTKRTQTGGWKFRYKEEEK